MKTSFLASSLLAVATGTFCISANAAPMTDIYPTPQSIKATGKEISATALAPFDADKYPALSEAMKAQRLKPAGKIKIAFDKNGSKLKKEMERAGKTLVNGAYWLNISTDKGIRISAADDSGKFYALQTLAQMIELDGKISTGEILDWPDLPFRGTVEGYYGNPWSPEARISQFRLYGKYKINTFIYGPKDDPYHRNKWKENYPSKEAETLREQISVARENHVNFVWTIHLGGNFKENDKPAEFAKLVSKLEFMYGLGVRSFGALFDDFGKADATLQSEICNYIVKNFLDKKKDCSPLIMCPSQYNKAWSDGSYLDELGDKLDKSVNIMWTGNSVCTDITEEGTIWINNRINRNAFIWWNWPCTDYCRTALCMGRTYGLDKANKGKLSGITGNPMDKPEASKIGIFGIGNWAWNIEAFDSEKTWKDSIKRLFPTCADAMQTFVNHNSDQGPNGHGYRREESVEFLPTINAAKKEYANSGKFSTGTQTALLEEFARIKKSAAVLTEDLPKSNPRLDHELEYWVKSFSMLGTAGTETTEMIAETNPDKKFSHAQQITRALAKMDEYFVSHKKKSVDESAFEGNKQWSNGCKVGALHVTPFVENLFKSEWVKLYKQLGGEGAGKSNAAAAYKALSNVPALNKVKASRDGKYVRIKVLEQIKLEPKQYLGIELPEGIYGNYIHLKLNNQEASDRGIIEISQDGKRWEKFNSRNNGQELQNGLDVKKKIRFFRYVNVSGEPIEIRTNEFKFDIPGDSKINSAEAMTDGDPRSFYSITKKTTIPPAKAGAKKAYVLASAPDSIKQGSDGSVEVAPQAGETVNVYEILWK